MERTHFSEVRKDSVTELQSSMFLINWSWHGQSPLDIAELCFQENFGSVAVTVAVVIGHEIASGHGGCKEQTGSRTSQCFASVIDWDLVSSEVEDNFHDMTRWYQLKTLSLAKHLIKTLSFKSSFFTSFFFFKENVQVYNSLNSKKMHYY